MQPSLTREQKEMIVEEVKEFFDRERGETIGDLAAEQWMDFMLKLLTPYVYNQAIHDAGKLMLERMTMLDEDLASLKKTIQPSR
ncbi:DUF2164 domain-containing protein [Marinicrinis sediminis]|uniref:DUF2164 domain-containing protein n=1 Tax=Marinicrinis sediminis TaxID=1652465 RepID=A0ABW5R754_9BACL